VDREKKQSVLLYENISRFRLLSAPIKLDKNGTIHPAVCSVLSDSLTNFSVVHPRNKNLSLNRI